MCGRYGFSDPEKIKKYYNLEDNLEDIKPRYNAAPSQELPVITKNTKLHIKKMKWGLIPFWAKEPSIGYKMINARAEGIDSKPSFRKPLKSQRCLVPASFFFEWNKKGTEKTPYLIKLTGKEVFSFAGLYDIWKDPVGKNHASFSIITTKPNTKIAKIHDRMPVILARNEESNWLNLEFQNPQKLLDSYPPSEIEMYPISKQVNLPANDYPDIIKPLNNSQ